MQIKHLVLLLLLDYIFKKTSKRLFSLRVLKRAGVPSKLILKVYLTIIRPILEKCTVCECLK